MDYQKLLTELGEQLGGTLDLTPDATGTVSLAVDSLRVNILGLEEIGQVVLSGDLGEPPPQGLERLYQAMLEAQHLFQGTGGATFSRNPEDGHLALCHAFAGDLLDGAGLAQKLEHFVNTLETWSKQIADYRADESEVRDEVESGMPLGGGLMQV